MDDLTNATSTLNFTLMYNKTITDYEIGASETFVSFLSSSITSTSYVFDQSTQTVYLDTSFSQTNLPSKIYIKSGFIITFYATNSAINQATL